MLIPNATVCRKIIKSIHRPHPHKTGNYVYRTCFLCYNQKALLNPSKSPRLTQKYTHSPQGDFIGVFTPLYFVKQDLHCGLWSFVSVPQKAPLINKLIALCIGERNGVFCCAVGIRVTSCREQILLNLPAAVHSQRFRGFSWIVNDVFAVDSDTERKSLSV